MDLAVREPLWFYLYNNWYTGKMPNFYDVSGFDSTKILESNYERLKKEILEFYETDSQSLVPNFTPYGYKEEGWRTTTLYGFGLKRPEVIKKFPVVDEVARQIPNMVSAQIAVLNPHTRVKAHFGDSNVIVRNHLGIVVPGKYPDLGFRNGSKEQCWEEGKVLAICIAHRHYVWNNTDHKRIILIVDTIHKDYADKKTYVCAGLLAAVPLKMISTKFPVTKKAPKWMVYILHKMATAVFMVVLFVQNRINFDMMNNVFSRMKVDL